MSVELTPEIIDIINETANNTAKMIYSKICRQKEREKETLFERRLYNVKILLDHYKGEIAVESIRNSALRTHIVIEHIESMLGIYEVYCEKSLRPEDLRRWDVINTLFIKDVPQGLSKMDIYNDLAEKHFVSERQIRMDVNDALIKLTALIFGIDGVKKFTQRNINIYTDNAEEK